MNRKDWTKAIKKALIDKGENQIDMANALGLTRQYVCNVINCKMTARSAVIAISDYCGVEPYEW